MEFTDLRQEDYPEFLKLYNSSFPENERRLYKDAGHLANFIKMKGGKFHAFAIKDGDLFLGFLSYWVFEGYVYIEHFAVQPEHRGRNIGSKLLQHLVREVSPNILLETELPVDDITRRRVKFYERNGFRPREEIKYIQPPYSSDQKPVELLLMTHGDVDLKDTKTLDSMLAEVYEFGKVR